ncbi:MAG TPA: hypothetical protein VFR86_23610 [Burkholderiaceae bacterium]|nr:hypothetical protein [Burkholderiaceae bacterium]
MPAAITSSTSSADGRAPAIPSDTCANVGAGRQAEPAKNEARNAVLTPTSVRVQVAVWVESARFVFEDCLIFR